MLIFIGLSKLGMSEDVDADTFDQFRLFGGGWLGAVQGRNIVEGRQSCLRLFGTPVFGMDHGGSNWSLVGLSRHCRRYARLERRRETEVITGAEPFKQLQRRLEFVGSPAVALRQERSDLPMSRRLFVRRTQ